MENDASHLPESCAMGVDDTPGALVVRRGDRGFSFYHSIIPNEYNQSYSITAAQVSAMLLGALTGWATPFIDASLFDPTGLFITVPREVALCAYWCAARGLRGHPDGDNRLPRILTVEAREAIRQNRQAFMASVRWRSFYFAEAKAAERYFL